MKLTAEQILTAMSDPRTMMAVQNMWRAQGMVAPQQGGVFKEQFDTTFAALSNPTIYGRNSIFSPCFNGDVFGLQVETQGIMNWLGWRRNKFWKRTVQFITWWRGEGADEGTTGAGSPCDDPLSWEWGECSYELCHTSWYHRQGQPLGPHNTQTRCETDRMARINGVPIRDEFEWQLNGIMNALQQDVSYDAVHGNHANAWEMNGLEAVVRQGYEDNNGNYCPMVDSWLIDWQNDDLDGAVNQWGNFFDFLHELVGQIEYRASGLGRIQERDMVLFMPRFLADCLLDSFTCYSVCGVTDSGDITDQALRGQILQYRQSLNGGPLWDGRSAVGYIRLKSGRRLPIMVDDTFDISKPNANYCADVYLLTRRIGNRDVFYGEYLDLATYANLMRKFNSTTGIRVEKGGRFSFKGKEDNWCGVAMVGMSPELYLSAPWAQARIQDVCCSRQLKPITFDPFQPDYLPGGAPLYSAGSYGTTCVDTPDAMQQDWLLGSE
jgi:hypothetical protein